MWYMSEYIAHSSAIHQRTENMSSVSCSYLFMKYSMDIVGPLSLAPGQLKYMLALMDYFSKWVEASAFVEGKEENVESFV